MSAGRWVVGGALVVAAAILLVGACVAAVSALSVDLGSCHDEAPRGTVGLIAVAIGAPVVLVLEGLTFGLLRAGRGERVAAVALGVGLAATTATMAVTAGEPACRDASLGGFDGSTSTGPTLVEAWTLAPFAVVAAGGIAAIVLAFRR